MFFLKKVLLGLGALILILLGGAGTQTQSTLLQGGGFLGLIIGLIVLYIFAKMAWRAMGCLPSLIVVIAVLTFILYAIGAFSDGIGNVGSNLKSFLGQGRTFASNTMGNTSQSSGTINLVDDASVQPISENFSSPNGTPATDNSSKDNQEGFFEKLFGQGSSTSKAAFNPKNFPAIYSSAEVVSGDTLVIGGHYFRLYGIDAPEKNQTCADSSGKSYSCGRQATAWLSGWLQDNQLECRVMQQDQAGNMMGVCSLGAYDIGAALVNAGWAVAYTQYTDIYVPYQIQAQKNSRGLWQGEFYMPWDWRKIQQRKPDIKIINKPKKKRRSVFNPLG